MKRHTVLAAWAALAALLSGPVAHSIPITVTPTSGLFLGSLVPSDLLATIPPGTSENPQNASVAVTGDPNTVFTIIFPQSTAALTTGGGGFTETIGLSAFTSFPAEGPNGLLNGLGQGRVFIGATRSAILPNQAPGSYSGTFDITVAN